MGHKHPRLNWVADDPLARGYLQSEIRNRLSAYDIETVTVFNSV